MIKLDNTAKRIIKKGSFDNVAYVYRDGVLIKTEEKHLHKGEWFRKEVIHKVVGEVGIFYSNGNSEKSFEGRLVIHDPSILLDGIKSVRIYLNNSSETMKAMNLTCNTVTLETLSGIRIKEDQFHFMSKDITIQDDNKMSINDWI